MKNKIFIILLIVLTCGCKRQNAYNNIPHVVIRKGYDSINEISKNSVYYNICMETLKSLVIPKEDLISNKILAIKYAKTILNAYYSDTLLNSSMVYDASLIKNKIWRIGFVIHNRRYYMTIDKKTGMVLKSSFNRNVLVPDKQVAIDLAKLIWDNVYKRREHHAQMVYTIVPLNNSLWYIIENPGYNCKGGDYAILMQKVNAKIIGLVLEK